MALYAVDGKNIVLHSAHAPVIHQSQDSRVVIIEHEAHSKLSRPALATTTGSSLWSPPKTARTFIGGTT